uniref:Uncharacterized protein n=1 Tax=Haptolina brevifila TaxID=156173 RepID=A0A7S2JNA8_9EUKA
MTSSRLLGLLVHLWAAVTVMASKDCRVTASYEDGTVIERECIVEGETKQRRSRRDAIDDMDWLKGTRWLWNDWREVVFLEDGSFLAPAESCERQGNPKCRWSASDGQILVTFGGAGPHTLTADDDKQTITGSRDSDGDAVQAKRVQ